MQTNHKRTFSGSQRWWKPSIGCLENSESPECMLWLLQSKGERPLGGKKNASLSGGRMAEIVIHATLSWKRWARKRLYTLSTSASEVFQQITILSLRQVESFRAIACLATLTSAQLYLLLPWITLKEHYTELPLLGLRGDFVFIFLVQVSWVVSQSVLLFYWIWRLFKVSLETYRKNLVSYHLNSQSLQHKSIL